MISLSAAGTSATTYTVAYTPGSPGTINWNTTPTGVSINPAAAAAHVNNHYYYDINCDLQDLLQQNAYCKLYRMCLCSRLLVRDRGGSVRI